MQRCVADLQVWLCKAVDPVLEAVAGLFARGAWLRQQALAKKASTSASSRVRFIGGRLCHIFLP